MFACKNKGGILEDMNRTSLTDPPKIVNSTSSPVRFCPHCTQTLITIGTNTNDVQKLVTREKREYFNYSGAELFFTSTFSVWCCMQVVSSQMEQYGIISRMLMSCL